MWWGRCSFASLHAQQENASVGVVRIRIEARDLERMKDKLARVMDVGPVLAPALESGDPHGLDPIDRLRRGEERTEIDGLSEREPIGVEQSQPAVWQDTVVELLEQGLVDVGPEMILVDAYRHVQLERNVYGVLDLEVVAGQAERLEELAQSLPEGLIDGLPALSVGGDEDGVPAARPPEPALCLKHVRRVWIRIALRESRVIVRGDRAQLVQAEILGSLLSHFFERLGIDAAPRRKRIPHPVDGRIRGDHMADRIPADVAVATVADPVARLVSLAFAGPGAETASVAEPQRCVAVILDLGDEILRGGAALDEVTPGSPGLRLRPEHCYRRQNLGRLPAKRARGGRSGFPLWGD